MICPSDANGDGFVNLCFGQPATPGVCDTGQDINNDGFVNVLDLVQVLLAFGRGRLVEAWLSQGVSWS